MTFLEQLRSRFGKLYNIDELISLEYNSKQKCFRYYNGEANTFDEDYAPLISILDKSTAHKFIVYAYQLLEKDSYTPLQMNEVFNAWLYVNEFDVLG